MGWSSCLTLVAACTRTPQQPWAKSSAGWCEKCSHEPSVRYILWAAVNSAKQFRARGYEAHRSSVAAVLRTSRQGSLKSWSAEGYVAALQWLLVEAGGCPAPSDSQGSTSWAVLDGLEAEKARVVKK